MKIALIGIGSVGRGVGEVLKNDKRFKIVAAADSKSGLVNPDGIDFDAIMAAKKKTGRCGTTDWTAFRIAAEVDYDTLVEVTPTNAETGEPALSTIKIALSRGKHVVTSNKGPISLAYRDLKALAKENNADIRFEGTVAGAVPIINGMKNGLAGNPVKALFGVLNGTCNYILSRMEEEGLTYQQALAEARDLGYAEADPTYDVNGTDAAIKLVILANSVLGMNVTLKDVQRTGIDRITPEAIKMAHTTGHTIRLIASLYPDKRDLEVSPRLLPEDDPLVFSETLNAITVETEYAGAITFIGAGAGSVETASAILSDLVFILKKYAL
ncbi:MAG TPA: homoserine dehydrogenase [Methanocorpusculum sp.]|nr:homoserine dehydrogenase [Candidatus Methanocorpusculum equi]MCQ2357796.1 homoserine dehydrogenase [Methanocorpusculum sp.]HJJ33328.1 homoserine dehydrogenase [Methanocorpusculum sp.]HJJ45270.1 homoserine dehydrogenase [Methanocorpusculum sp.]HJJ58621.1 homoserine dehydrogenase [Methanocorpusculum sp.]